jgi:ankyrin repeat protein
LTVKCCFDLKLVLLEHGADPQPVCGLGATPVGVLISLDRPDSLRALLARDPAAANAYIMNRTLDESCSASFFDFSLLTTPAHACVIAQRYPRIECLKVLIEAGANLGARDRYGFTPLMYDVGEKTGSDGRYWWVFFQGLIAAAPLFGRDRPLKVFERWQI